MVLVATLYLRQAEDNSFTPVSGGFSGSGIACEDALTLVLKAPTERMEIVLKSLHIDSDKIVTLYKDHSSTMIVSI